MIGKEKSMRVAEGKRLETGRLRRLAFGLRSHPVQGGDIYTTLIIAKKIVLCSADCHEFFCKRNDLGKGSIESESLHLKLYFLSK